MLANYQEQFLSPKLHFTSPNKVQGTRKQALRGINVLQNISLLTDRLALHTEHSLFTLSLGLPNT